MQHRELLYEEWLKVFPDEASRPARHAMKAALPGTLVVQLEFIAVLDQWRTSRHAGKPRA